MQTRRYRQWAGNPNGDPEDETRCYEEVYERFGFGLGYQCQRKRGYGKDGLFCKQHAKKYPAEEKERILI